MARRPTGLAYSLFALFPESVMAAAAAAAACLSLSRFSFSFLSRCLLLRATRSL